MSSSELRTRSTTMAWIIGIVILLGLPIAVMYLFVGGEIQGEEFSPDDFSSRRFSYNVMPLLNVTLRGIQHHNSSSVFEQTLVADGWITVPNGPQRWHLVYDTGTRGDSPDFDASILTDLLDETKFSGDNLWQNWNDEHPKLAKLLWPAIADLARNNLYWATPDILCAARNVTDDSDPQFTQFLNQHVAAAFRDQADSFRAGGNHQQAIEFYSIAIEYHPSQKALLGRSKSYGALGEREKSQRDEQASTLNGDR